MCAIQLKQETEVSAPERELNSTCVDRGQRRLSLRSNFIWTLIGNVVYAGCQWGMLVALAKLGTPEMVGRFGIALAITAPVVMFSNLQLKTIQATDAKQEYLFKDYLGLRFISLLFAIIVITAVTWFSGYHGETALVILTVGLSKIPESISDIFFGLFTQREQLHYVSKSMIINGILSVAAFCAGLRLTHSVIWAAVALTGVNTLVLLSYDLHNGKKILICSIKDLSESVNRLLCPRWIPKKYTQLALLALPMGIVALLSSLNINIPRYFIERYMGERDLGIFVSMAYIQVAGTVVVRALGYTVCSRLGNYYAESNITAFRNMTMKMLAGGLIISLAGVVMAWKAGRFILSILYKPAYATHSDTFIWIMIGATGIYLAMFLGYSLTAARRLNVQTILMIISSIITALMCILLVPNGGLNGAAIALGIGNSTWATGSLIVLVRVFYTNKRKFPENLAL